MEFGEAAIAGHEQFAATPAGSRRGARREVDKFAGDDAGGSAMRAVYQRP